MDSVLTYHTNPLTCGVARFNKALADHLGLSMHQMFSPKSLACETPLLSIKLSEFAPADIERLCAIVADPSVWPHLRLFLHDYGATQAEALLIRRAQRIYCANEFLLRELNPLHASVVQAWCPGHLFDQRLYDPKAEITIYTFGMAHKLRADYYYGLRDMLERTGQSYSVFISAAIHEGTSLDDSFTSAYEDLDRIFGSRVYFLGFVSDGSLYNYLRSATFFAAFFQTGVRANNTSVNTAMQCGSVVLTNLDEASPPDFRHMETVVDIRQCNGRLPTDKSSLARISCNAKEVAGRLGWAPLLSLFNEHETRMGLPRP